MDAKLVLRRLVAVIFLGAVTLPALCAPKYTLTMLPLMPSGINNKGHVIGSVTKKGGSIEEAVLWREGRIVRLNSDPDIERFGSYAKGINDSDEVAVAAWSDGAIMTSYPFVWRKGRIIRLEDPAGRSAAATGINSNGRMVGSHYQGGEGSGGALEWDAKYGKVIYDPWSTFHWFNSTFLDINDHDDIVGYYQSGGEWQAFLLRGSKLTAIGDASTTNQCNPRAINSRRQVVGESQDTQIRGAKAFIWQNGKLRYLPGLGGAGSSAVDINERGEIVGSSYTSSEEQRAVIWKNRRVFDLNLLVHKRAGWTLTQATAIDDRGEIVGKMMIGREKWVGVILRPVKNPGSAGKGSPTGRRR